MSEMKFVTFLDHYGEHIIVFPKHIQHAQFARAVNNAAYSNMEPIAGGFVAEGECYGESVSLRLGSRERDTELLNELTNGKRPDLMPEIAVAVGSDARISEALAAMPESKPYGYDSKVEQRKRKKQEREAARRQKRLNKIKAKQP